MPWLKGLMSLGLGGAAANCYWSHVGVLLTVALAECIVLNCAPKPNMGNLLVMCQSCEGTALLATGRLISQGPPSIFGHYPLRYYIREYFHWPTACYTHQEHLCGAGDLLF